VESGFYINTHKLKMDAEMICDFLAINLTGQKEEVKI